MSRGAALATIKKDVEEIVLIISINVRWKVYVDIYSSGGQGVVYQGRESIADYSVKFTLI